MNNALDAPDAGSAAGAEPSREFFRGWGNYFRTGNASNKFVQMDRHVAWRLKRLLIEKRGGNLRAGQADRWTPAGSTTRTCISSWAPSATRRLRNGETDPLSGHRAPDYQSQVSHSRHAPPTSYFAIERR
jgi:Group II intron, maturase-specific domain